MIWNCWKKFYLFIYFFLKRDNFNVQICVMGNFRTFNFRTFYSRHAKDFVHYIYVPFFKILITLRIKQFCQFAK